MNSKKSKQFHIEKQVTIQTRKWENNLNYQPYTKEHAFAMQTLFKKN